MNQPNIILFNIDDLGIRDLSCYGSSFYETRHIDRLAARGAIARNGYAASPVCTPTRAALMTGKSPARLGLTQIIPALREGSLKNVPFPHYLSLEETSVASALSKGGYQTWHVGKWHLGGEGYSPTDHGFDINIAGSEWGLPPHGFISPWKLPNYSDGPEGAHLTDALTEDAIGLIEKRDGERPFFLNFCHYSVHEPIQAPKAYIEYYQQKAQRLGLDQIDPILHGEPIRFKHPENFHVMRRQVQSMPEYAAMVHHLDDNIGRVITSLRRNGLLDETLILFTSDNGGVGTHSFEEPFTCNHPWAEGKGWCEEGGVRVPYIAHWPSQIPAGTVIEEMIVSMDIFPTCLEAAQLPMLPDQHQDGISLLPMLTASACSLERDHLCFHYPHYSRQGGCPASSIVQDGWKLIWSYEDNRSALYHLENDPSESVDLVEREPKKARELKTLLRQWHKEVDAKHPEPNTIQ